jgi:hypothetical protein
MTLYYSLVSVIPAQQILFAFDSQEKDTLRKMELHARCWRLLPHKERY